MIDEQHVFFRRLRIDEPGAQERLRELHVPRDIRTASVTSVILNYMRSQGDDDIAQVFELIVDRAVRGGIPEDAWGALADLVASYRADDDCDNESTTNAMRYLCVVAKVPPKTIRRARELQLTALHRRLLDAMLAHKYRVTFDELREAWDGDVQDETIEKTLKRLRDNLPRSQWGFEISRARREIVWHKKGQSVP